MLRRYEEVRFYQDGELREGPGWPSYVDEERYELAQAPRRPADRVDQRMRKRRKKGEVEREVGVDEDVSKEEESDQMGRPENPLNVGRLSGLGCREHCSRRSKS
jgi:hypothetical protein